MSSYLQAKPHFFRRFFQTLFCALRPHLVWRDDFFPCALLRAAALRFPLNELFSHVLPAEDMNVQMKDCLPRVLTLVHDQTIAAVETQ